MERMLWNDTARHGPSPFRAEKSSLYFLNKNINTIFLVRTFFFKFAVIRTYIKMNYLRKMFFE